MARKVLGAKDMNHEQRVAFQEAILNLDKPVDVESKYCVPRLADKTQKQEHFYNDTFKFSVCLPTKTGCTNWQRGLGNVSHTLCRLKGFTMNFSVLTYL